VYLITGLSNFYYASRILVFCSCFCSKFMFRTDKGIFLTSHHITFIRRPCNTAQVTFLEPESIMQLDSFIPFFYFYLQLKLFQQRLNISNSNLCTKFQNPVLNTFFSLKFGNINGSDLKGGQKGLQVDHC
jgi:hypothetical protein